MKKLFKIFLFILAFPTSSLACDLNKILFDKNYKKVSEEYKVTSDVLDANYFEANTRGENICDELKNAEVTLIFVNEKLGGIKINGYNLDEITYYNLVVDSFEKPVNEPNLDKLVGSFATYFDSENLYTTYKISKGDKYQESINIFSKKYIAEIDKSNTSEEVDEGKNKN